MAVCNQSDGVPPAGLPCSRTSIRQHVKGLLIAAISGGNSIRLRRRRSQPMPILHATRARSAFATRMVPPKLLRFMSISFSTLSLEFFGAPSGLRILHESVSLTKFLDSERKLVSARVFPFLLGRLLIMLAQEIARRIQRSGFRFGLQQSCEFLRQVDEPAGFPPDRFVDEDFSGRGFLAAYTSDRLPLGLLGQSLAAEVVWHFVRPPLG
jgi:hypothetical protein